MTSSNSHDTSYDPALAIIGMSGRFPGAQNVETFWHNIAAGIKSIRTFSDQALEEAGVDRDLLTSPNYVKAGAVLEGIEQFDASFFGYSPCEAETMDPQHRLFLECAWEALEESGYDPQTYRGLVGIFAGSGFSTYLVHNLYTNPELLETIGQLQVAVGNERDSLVSTVSYKLNLKGPAVAVQTFCSTSLVAIHLACQSLLSYECDLALAGGVAIAVPHLTGYLYEEGGIVSPDGQCRSFDAQAQGSVMGNGVGVVTLKRLADALQDGDHIHALIRGSAVNNDGSVRVSYTAPGLDGQSEVIAEAMGHAAVPIETIGYIEAHGTATRLGDAVELAAMHKAFAASTAGYGSCAIGSVKPNVGHLDRASGVTGLIKTVQALRHGQLPPSLNFEQPSAELNLQHSPFYVNTHLHEWPRRDGTPRRAGVSSFGLGGTNAHVVLEEAPPAQPVAPSRAWHLLVLSAKSETALQQAGRNLAQHLRAHPEQALADVAYTLQVGRTAFSHRQALVCGSREEAIGLLEGREPGRVTSRHLTQREPGVIFLFPGLGEQELGGMASELSQHEPHFRQAVEQCCALLKRQGVHLEQVLLAEPSGKGASVAAAHMKQTALAQPAVFVVEYALAQLLQHWGIVPQALLGYSLGEYVAACLAGVLSLQDALWLVVQRARLLEDLPPGAMLAVALSETGVQPYLDDLVELAAVNAPSTCVLAGPLEAIEQVEERLQELEVEQRRVDTRHAWHCSMLAPLHETLTALVGRVELHAPSRPLISNVTGTWLTDEQATDPSYWAQQLCQTVRLAQGIEQVGRVGQQGQPVCVEVGVGQVLSSLVSQHPAWRSEGGQGVFSTLPSRHEPGSAQAALLGTLGQLWLSGVSIDWPGFYAQEPRQRVSLPTYPFERQRYWIEPNKLIYNVAKASTIAIDDEEKIEDLSDWFYVPSWKQALSQQPFAQSDIPVETEHWLLFIDDYGIGMQIAQQLEQYHQDVTVVRPGTTFGRSGEASYTVGISIRSDYEKLLRELRTVGKTPHKIVHMWTVTPDSPEQDAMTAVSDMLNAGFYSLLALAQALGDAGIDTCHITVISSSMQDVTGNERLRPEKATVIGPCRVIPQEYSNIDCRSIDIILPQAGRKQEELVVHQLVGELTSDLSHTVVAFRGAHRWLQTFEPVRLSSQDTRNDMLRYGGVYLITGGLGGIGLAMADYLARTVQARLVLITRSGLPPRSEWESILQEQGDTKGVGQQIPKVQALESQGAEVLIFRANIADETQMRHVVEQALATFGTLNGVLHAAGVPASGLMQLKAPELPAGVFAPKVMGTLILERVLRNIPLDFLVLFSSMSSTTGGGPGQVDYCAANAYLDVYARKNFTKHGMTIAVNWGEWQWDAWDAGLQGYPQEAP